MSEENRTTVQRVAQEVVDALADQTVVLNDVACQGSTGGGDVDCAAVGVRPFWHLRLREWRLCQALRYDTTATYYVAVRGDETVALDVLDDPLGTGKYGFRTSALASSDGRGGLADPVDRAAYLAIKAIVKGSAGGTRWESIRELAQVAPDVFVERLRPALGEPLARDLARAVLEEDGPRPSDAIATAVREQLSRRRRLSVRTWRQRGARVAHRVLRPTGLVVALVGPDGTGKSTLSGALPPACGQLFRRSLGIHFRPGVLPRPGAVVPGRRDPDSSQPHARQPHGAAISTLLLAYHWVDALLGYAFRVAPVRRRTGLVVLERSFLDLAVDPTRYRLRVSPALVRALARALPRPDVTIILEADPGVVVARKAELSRAEIERQVVAWHETAPGAVTIDVSQPLPEVTEAARAAVVDALEERCAERLDGGWAAVPPIGAPLLWLPRRRAAALGALRVQSPSSATSRLGLALAKACVGAGGARLLPGTAPPADVRRALAGHIPARSTYSVRRAIHPGRYLAVVIGSTGRPLALGKVATNDATRARIAGERETLEHWGQLVPAPLRAPRVLSYDDDVLMLEWIPHSSRRQPWVLPVDVAAALGAFFATGRSGRPELRGPAHGDFAPWNLLRCEEGWALVDWEVFVEDAPAYFDVFHYLVQGHAFLGRPSASEILRGVEGRGWIADVLAAYAAAADVDVGAARGCFVEYLQHTSSPATRRDMGERSLAVRRSLMAGVRI